MGMDPGGGAGGAMGDDPMAAELFQRALKHRGDSEAVLLNLPAAIAGAVVGEGEKPTVRNGGHVLAVNQTQPIASRVLLSVFGRRCRVS